MRTQIEPAPPKLFLCSASRSRPPAPGPGPRLPVFFSCVQRLLCCFAALLLCCFAALLLCCFAALLLCCFAALCGACGFAGLVSLGGSSGVPLDAFQGCCVQCIGAAWRWRNRHCPFTPTSFLAKVPRKCRRSAETHNREVPALSSGTWRGRPPRGAGVIAFRTEEAPSEDAFRNWTRNSGTKFRKRVGISGTRRGQNSERTRTNSGTRRSGFRHSGFRAFRVQA